MAESGLQENENVKKAIKDGEARLGVQGRVFVRMSGTEPLVRVLVEARDDSALFEVSEQILDTIKEAGAAGSVADGGRQA